MSKRWSCEECTYSMQETADDVACCNCCKNGSFFEQYKDEYTLADGGDTMELKCPYCGSAEYECYDRVGDGTMTPEDLCVCEKCDKQFSILYTAYRIKKES